MRLDVLLPLVLGRSPRIATARARLEAVAERYPQEVALPDPMVEARYFTRNAMAIGEPFDRYDLMVRQEIPFPALLRWKGRAARTEAQAEALRYEAAVRDAVAELKEVHAERAYLAQAAAVQSAIRDIYRRYAELARADMTAGRTRLPESFRAEALLAQAGYDLLVVEELRAVEDQRLRALLALPPGTPIGDPADVGGLLPVAVDDAELAARAESYNQELRAAGVDVETASIGTRIARWENAPTVSLGVGRMMNDEFMEATGETRNSEVVTVGLTLPFVWFQKRAAAVREAERKLAAARAGWASERENLRAEVARAAFRLRNAERLSTLYAKEIVPQAELALLRSQEMVREGKETLASSLELAATWQQLRIAQLRAEADHAQAAAKLERLLGTSLVPAALEERGP
ncbi:MAG: TolC family protein [Planctomycetota bacterium]